MSQPKWIRRSATRRLFQLLLLFFRHLAGYLISRVLKLFRIASSWRMKRPLLSDASIPLRLRLFLESSGGALIKAGQVLAMRVDFLPHSYIEELLQLLDEVPPFDPQQAKQIIESELQGEISDLFESFEEEPMASASFAQVHAATLKGGREVVVKVQRPGVKDIVTADLRLFRILTILVDASSITRRALLRPVYEDFAVWTREEIDYRIEGSYIQEICDCAADSPTEKIPQVYWDLTSVRVLTMERLRGIWVKEIMQGLSSDHDEMIRRLHKHNTDLDQVSLSLFRNTLRQIFDYGIYHADPHAGNVLITKNGVIGYVDFGITGRISKKSKAQQVKIHSALESGDFDRFYAAIIDTVHPPYHANLKAFEGQVRHSYNLWLRAQYMGGTNSRDKSFARLMLGISYAAQRSGVAFSSMEIRIFRALATVDAVLLDFGSTLDVRGEFRSFFREYRIRTLMHEDIPAVIHQIPDMIQRVAQHMEGEFFSVVSQVSKMRRFISVVLGGLALLLVVGGILALSWPGIVAPWLKSLNLGGLQASAIVVLGILFFAWLSRLLALRSVIVNRVTVRGRSGEATDRRPS